MSDNASPLPPPELQRPSLASPTDVPPPQPAAATAAPAQPWEASTMRFAKGDPALSQTLNQVAQHHACLILYSGEEAGQRFALDGRLMTLGRSPECPICLDHPGISRCHAELTMDDDGFVLHDLASSNGTLVNGHRLEAPTRLRDGDLIRLGKVALKFYERLSLDALMHDRIYRMATVDAGTEAYTKRYLMEALERELKRARRNEHPLCVLCFDLDHFKAVNDEFGHNAGDAVLRATAAVAQEQVRGSDVLGRIGGEEFAVVLPETDLHAAIELAERMRVAIAERQHTLAVGEGSHARSVLHRQTASFGVAQMGTGQDDARGLLGAADLMLYAAKRGGRNRVNS